MKRGRNQRRRQGGSNPNRALDSNGPDVRIRGTANQIYDKYTALARDASSAGDRIKAESYLQHAEHYFRVIRAQQPPPQQQSIDADGDQPNVANGESRNGDQQSGDRQHSGRQGGGRNDRRRERPAANNEQPAPAEEAKPAEAPVAASVAADAGAPDASAVGAADDAAAEPKPKRRRTKRAVKSADAGGDEVKKEKAEEAPAAAE